MGYEYARIFGRNINQQLNNQGIDIGEFADYMGFKFEDVMLLLDGRLKLSLQEMNKIAEFLGVNVMELGKNKVR